MNCWQPNRELLATLALEPESGDFGNFRKDIVPLEWGREKNGVRVEMNVTMGNAGK